MVGSGSLYFGGSLESRSRFRVGASGKEYGLSPREHDRTFNSVYKEKS
jgi:hypothetical protein